MDADRAQDFEHVADETDVKHRLGQFDVSKVSGTVLRQGALQIDLPHLSLASR